MYDVQVVVYENKAEDIYCIYKTTTTRSFFVSLYSDDTITIFILSFDNVLYHLREHIFSLSDISVFCCIVGYVVTMTV